MATSKSSLTRFSVKPTHTSAGQGDSPAITAGTRGKGKKVGIAVRLSQEDWYRASEFALRQHTSLQRLLVAGLSELMRQKGLPPLAGD